jgi:hypothetical protein
MAVSVKGSMINDPTNEELEQPCPCGSQKPFKDCCREKVMKTLRIMRENQAPDPAPWVAKRGYQHWSDLVRLDRESGGGQEKEWFPFLQSLDDFFGFWKDQIVAVIRRKRK